MAFVFHLGFSYWLKVGENLGLKNRCRQWLRRVVNPTDNLLKAFAEKRESTIRKLIEASEKAGLTLFASELENRFSPKDNQSGSEENVPHAPSAGLTPVVCEIE